MEVSYTITFTPQDPINYEYDMVVVTEREKFIVPLKALGPRPRFDFPDAVDFSSAPVRVETSKVLLVRNVGNASGSFTCTAAEPFFISPQTCVLEPQEAVQVTVTFFPDDIKDISSDIKIQYSSDEVVYMKVAGTVQELDVGLEANIVEMDNTYAPPPLASNFCVPNPPLSLRYVTLFSQKTFKIYNKSDLPVQFEFKSLSSNIEDEKARARFRSELSQSLPDFVTDVEFEQYAHGTIVSLPVYYCNTLPQIRRGCCKHASAL
jgi:hydrocephalus-inducing protein